MAEDALDADGDAAGRRKPDAPARGRRDADHLAVPDDGADRTEKRLADHRGCDRNGPDGAGPDVDEEVERPVGSASRPHDRNEAFPAGE